MAADSDFIIKGEIILDDKTEEQIDAFQRRLEGLNQSLQRIGDVGSYFDPEDTWGRKMRVLSFGAPGGIENQWGSEGLRDYLENLDNAREKMESTARSTKDLADALNELHDKARKASASVPAAPIDTGEITGLSREETLSQFDDLFRDIDRFKGELSETADKARALHEALAQASEVTAEDLLKEREYAQRVQMGSGILSRLLNLTPEATETLMATGIENQAVGRLLAGLGGAFELAGNIWGLLSGPIGIAAGIATTAGMLYNQGERIADYGNVIQGQWAGISYLDTMTGDRALGIEAEELKRATRGFITDLQSATLITRAYNETMGRLNRNLDDYRQAAEAVLAATGGRPEQVGQLTLQLATAGALGDVQAISRLTGGLVPTNVLLEQWQAQTGQAWGGLGPQEQEEIIRQWLTQAAQGLIAQGATPELLYERGDKTEIAKQEFYETFAQWMQRNFDRRPGDIKESVTTGFWEGLARFFQQGLGVGHQPLPGYEEQDREWLAQQARAARWGTVNLGLFESQLPPSQRAPIYMPMITRTPEEQAAMTAAATGMGGPTEFELWQNQIAEIVGRQLTTARHDAGLMAVLGRLMTGTEISASPLGALLARQPQFRGLTTNVDEWREWLEELAKLPDISEDARNAIEALATEMEKLDNVQSRLLRQAQEEGGIGGTFGRLSQLLFGGEVTPSSIPRLFQSYWSLPENIRQYLQQNVVGGAREYIQRFMMGPETPDRGFSSILSGVNMFSSILMGTVLNPYNVGNVSAEDISEALNRIIDNWLSFNERLQRIHGDNLTEMRVYRMRYLRELNEFMQGNQRAMEQAQESYRQSMGLRSYAQQALFSRLTPTPEDFLATELGQYQEAPMEEVRQLQAFIERGVEELKKHQGDAEWQKSIKLFSQEAIEKALAGDDKLLRLEAMRRQREFLELRRLPEDLSAFERTFRDWFEGQAAKERNLQYLENYLRQRGFTGDLSEDLKKFFGLETPEMRLKVQIEAQRNARERFIKSILEDKDALEIPVVLKLKEEDDKEKNRVADKISEMIESMDVSQLKSERMKTLGESMREAVTNAFDPQSLADGLVKDLDEAVSNRHRALENTGVEAGKAFMHGLSQAVDTQSKAIVDLIVAKVLDALNENRHSGGGGKSDDSSPPPPAP